MKRIEEKKSKPSRAFVALGSALLLLYAVVFSGCGAVSEDQARNGKNLRIFHAAGLTPFLDDLREDCRRDLKIELQTEASGSQMACRKLSELGRQADLLMLADNLLVTKLLDAYCDWRIDFATDAIVLGVGAWAPRVAEAEEDWVPVLLDEKTSIARVDENLGPIGYRTLLVWQLQEQLGHPGLAKRLRARCHKVLDHVSRLTPLLKNGEIDYAFVYRSICIASDIRYIELDKRVNLSSTQEDYSRASVSFEKLKAGEKESVSVRGAPATWTLCMPREGADHELAGKFIEYLLSKQQERLKRNGLTPLVPPRFYGQAPAHRHFAKFTRYAGRLR